MSLPVLEAVVIQELNIENKSINEITQESANIAKNLNEENLKKPFKVSGFSNDKQYIYILCHVILKRTIFAYFPLILHK
jgi:hypothetical protein